MESKIKDQWQRKWKKQSTINSLWDLPAIHSKTEKICRFAFRMCVACIHNLQPIKLCGIKNYWYKEHFWIHNEGWMAKNDQPTKSTTSNYEVTCLRRGDSARSSTSSTFLFPLSLQLFHLKVGLIHISYLTTIHFCCMQPGGVDVDFVSKALLWKTT